MSPTLDQMREAQRALEAPLFSGLPGDIEVSFEFFPPKSDKMGETLWQSVETLAPLGPRFASVTYGAGGSTRERTHQQVVRIQNEAGIPADEHLTCVEASSEQVDDVARHYWEEGIRHIVALRGDPPDGQSRYSAHPGGYANAAELIAGLKKVADFEISVAAYPEVHPDSSDRKADLDNLKAKFDAGAKYHVPGNVPYTRYFLARILQFQFFKAACDQAGWDGPLHRCSFYGNEEVGKNLNAMLEMGASKPWPDALEAFTGERQMSGEAMVEYFAPLKAWLDEQNAGKTEGG